VTPPLLDAALERLRGAADAPDLAGTPYVLRERLGRGGMGVVFRVHDPRLGRDVALKLLDLGAPGGEESARLEREARILAELEHPGIVPVHDVGRLADGRTYYVMKLVQGARLDRHVASVEALGERLRLFLRLCEPVAFAHLRGFVHRDLKPENVMVGPFGEVLVLDWGVARSPAQPAEAESGSAARGVVAGETAAGAILGTAGYMSPEQERGDSAHADPRSDVFALGRVLLFLARAGGREIAPPLAAIAARAAAPRIEERYASVTALAEDVERFLDGAPVAAYRETPGERIARWFRRYQVAVVLVLAYLVLRLALLLLLPR
jgi:serine/threonine protein kinase